MADGAADGRAAGLVLTPDVVHGLARDRDPAARFAGDLDHASRVRVGSAIALALDEPGERIAPGDEARCTEHADTPAEAVLP